VHLAKRAVAGTLVLIMVLSTMMISLSASGAKVTYEYYVIGDPSDSDATPSPGLLLAGGSTDVAEAMEWMIKKSGGGDFVVLRCAGTDAYNPWIYKQLAEPGELNSCETIIFLEPESCEDPVLIGRIVNAEALFIAGGDQWNYVSMWKGTPVEAAIHSVRDKGAPIGGTSAGLAILGEFVFSAENDTVESDDALRNPYNRRVCLEKGFLDMPDMDGKITDSHFVARDRMGRLVTFLARIVQDGWATEARGIGIDEETALGVDPDGTVTLFGACKDGTAVAYFLRTNGEPDSCEPKTPLTYKGISVFKMTIGAKFNLATWQGDYGTSYSLSAVEGVLASTQSDGSIY